MIAKNIIKSLMGLAYIFIYYPVFLRTVLINEKKNKLIFYTIVINITLPVIIIVFKNYFHSEAVRFFGVFTPIFLCLWFSIYMLFFRKRLSNAMGLNKKLDVEAYKIKLMSIAQNWDLQCKTFIIIAILFLPIALILNRILLWGCLYEIIIDEVLIIFSILSWKVNSKAISKVVQCN